MKVDSARLEAARAHVERRLTLSELDAYSDAPISDSERTELLELTRWFTARYPTGAARLAYVRRALRRPVRRFDP